MRSSIPNGVPFIAKNTPTTPVSSLDVAVTVTTPERTAFGAGLIKSIVGTLISDGVPVPLTKSFTSSMVSVAPPALIACPKVTSTAPTGGTNELLVFVQVVVPGISFMSPK